MFKSNLTKSVLAMFLASTLVLASTFGGWSAGEAKAGTAEEIAANRSLTSGWMSFAGSFTLPADMSIDGDTEHTSFYLTEAGDTLTATGTLVINDSANSNSLVDHVDAVETQLATMYGSTYASFFSWFYNSITLSDLSSSFTATMTLPDGLSFDTSQTATLNDTTGMYSGVTTTYSGQTATIVIYIEDSFISSNMTTYAGLRTSIANLVNTVGELEITLPGITVDSNASAGTLYTMTGTLTGGMKATASAMGTWRNFSYTWNGEQVDTGADYKYYDSSTDAWTDYDISLSVLTPVYVQVEATKVLEGASLVAGAYTFTIDKVVDESGNTLTDSEGNTITYTQTNAADGSITFDKTNLAIYTPGTYTVYVSEEVGTDTNTTYDTTQKTQTLVVAYTYDSNGIITGLSYTYESEEGITFTNVYTAKATSSEATASDATASDATSSDADTIIVPSDTDTNTNKTTRRSSSGGSSGSSSSRVVTTTTTSSTTTSTTTVATPSDPISPMPVPKTGESTDTMHYMALLFTSIVALCAVALGLKKRQ